MANGCLPKGRDLMFVEALPSAFFTIKNAALKLLMWGSVWLLEPASTSGALDSKVPVTNSSPFRVLILISLDASYGTHHFEPLDEVVIPLIVALSVCAKDIPKGLPIVPGPRTT